MISLEKATLGQIVAELRRRANLTFALVALRTGGRHPDAAIFASEDASAIGVTMLLQAAAQDVLEHVEHAVRHGSDENGKADLSPLTPVPSPPRSPRGLGSRTRGRGKTRRHDENGRKG